MVHTLARPLWHGIVAALLLAGAAEAQAPGGADAPPPTVTVLTLASGDVTLTSSLPGRVVASGFYQGDVQSAPWFVRNRSAA